MKNDRLLEINGSPSLIEFDSDSYILSVQKRYLMSSLNALLSVVSLTQPPFNICVWLRFAVDRAVSNKFTVGLDCLLHRLRKPEGWSRFKSALSVNLCCLARMMADFNRLHHAYITLTKL